METQNNIINNFLGILNAKKSGNKSLMISFILALAFPVYGQKSADSKSKVTISGYVTDSENGELLIGVTIIDVNRKTGSSTNAYGFYSITVPAGDYELQYSYLGYQSVFKKGITDKSIWLIS